MSHYEVFSDTGGADRNCSASYGHGAPTWPRNSSHHHSVRKYNGRRHVDPRARSKELNRILRHQVPAEHPSNRSGFVSCKSSYLGNFSRNELKQLCRDTSRFEISETDGDIWVRAIRKTKEFIDLNLSSYNAQQYWGNNMQVESADDPPSAQTCYAPHFLTSSNRISLPEVGGTTSTSSVKMGSYGSFLPLPLPYNGVNGLVSDEPHNSTDHQRKDVISSNHDPSPRNQRPPAPRRVTGHAAMESRLRADRRKNLGRGFIMKARSSSKSCFPPQSNVFGKPTSSLTMNGTEQDSASLKTSDSFLSTSSEGPRLLTEQTYSSF